MRPATLAEVARVLDARLTAGDERDVRARCGGRLEGGARRRPLLRPARTNGRLSEFAPEAYLRGAVAAVASRPLEVLTLVVGDPLEAMQRLARWTLDDSPAPLVVGITGTVGKTTTKDALATVLRYAGKRVSATAGNFNNEIGLPLTVLAADQRTEILVLEMGATHPGDIKHLAA